MRPAVIICLIILVSCGGNAPPPVPDNINSSITGPVSLIFENKISGRILTHDLLQPSGLAIDTRGDIYISDNGNHRIIKLDQNLKTIRDYGGYGTGMGRLQNPNDLFVDRVLNLYVLDTGNRRVVHLDANLNFVEEIIPEDDPEEIISTLTYYSGLAVSPMGELTVADYDNSRLIRMDNFNHFSRYIGDFGYGQGTLLNPKSLALDQDGNHYVADMGNKRIAVFDDYGNFIRQIGSQMLESPEAVAVGNNGLVWVSDSRLRTIMAFHNSGKLIFDGLKEMSPDTKLDNVQALTVTPDGKLFVANTGNNEILIYRIIYEANKD
ncbi:MAG: NHL repeat-containing protein [candidate division Zixibacteria bacterium]